MLKTATFKSLHDILSASEKFGRCVNSLLLPSSTLSARNKMPKATVCSCHGHLWGSFTVQYGERGPHRIWRHDAQVKLLARDLAKAARHPVVEERPVGRHRERPDIRALGRSSGTDLFDVTICHPLRHARIRDVSENPVNRLKAAWTAKVSRFASMLQATGTGLNLPPVPLSTLGGWHPDVHKALCSVASTIAARGLSSFSRARSILFQRHAALLVTNNARCPMSGLLSDIEEGLCS